MYFSAILRNDGKGLACQVTTSYGDRALKNNDLSGKQYRLSLTLRECGVNSVDSFTEPSYYHRPVSINP